MPIPESQAVLKSFFETGDTPTQAQFAELIDTMFALFQNSQTTANAAVATANAAAAATGRVLLSCPTSVWPAVPVPDQQLNVQSLTYLGTPLGIPRVRVTFTTPFINIRYVTAVLTNLNKITPSNAAYIDVDVVSTSARWELLLFGQQ